MAQQLSEYVTTRRIGQATVTAITEGLLPWALKLQVPESEWRLAMPEADAEGRIPLQLHQLLIQHGSASILVDPGFNDPASAQDERLIQEWPDLIRTPGLHAALAQIGLAPAAITHVLVTHGHEDHFEAVTTLRENMRVPRYPHAHVFLGRGDWYGNPERSIPDSATARHFGTLEQLGLLDLVETEQEIVPGVTMVPAPGETPGHCIVRLESEGQVFLYLGDLFHHSCEIGHPDWIPAKRDAPVLAATRRRVLTGAVRDKAVAVFTHELFPPWGRIVEIEGGFAWERI